MKCKSLLSKRYLFQISSFKLVCFLFVCLSLFSARVDAAERIEIPCKYRAEFKETLDYSEGSNHYTYEESWPHNTARIGFKDFDIIQKQYAYRVAAEFDISRLEGKSITG
ncbi:MAG: hypothetical protein ACOC98_03500, partial [Thermodesulfobacteriota bacterium]